MFDLSGLKLLIRLASKISMLAKKNVGLAWVFASINSQYQCFVAVTHVNVIPGHQTGQIVKPQTTDNGGLIHVL